MKYICMPMFYTHTHTHTHTHIFPGGSDDKASACNAEDLGLILGSGRSPGERNGYPLQYPCLENSMDRGSCEAKVHGIANDRT